MSEQEEIRKLREGIDKALDVHIDWIQGAKRDLDFNLPSMPYYLTAPCREKLIDSLLRTVLSDLKIDTGELTDEETKNKLPFLSKVNWQDGCRSSTSGHTD